MEKTKTPKQIIQSYLEERAKNDPLFASVYAKPNKNINECLDYILSEAKKRGNAVCMSDDEVFGLAVHYYDEDDIKVSKQTNYKAATSQAPKSDVGAAPGSLEKMKSRRKGKKNESSSLQFSLFEGL